MDRAKKQRLEAAGWKTGSVADFLGLSPEEEALIDLKLCMGYSLKKRRQALNWTQAQLAKRLMTSQSRVAKMESGHPSVSLDLLTRALLAAGVTRRELGRIIGTRAAA